MKLRRPSPALAVSIVALIVALGGTATAATLIGTKQLRNNAVISSKIKNSSIQSSDIKNGTVSPSDLSKGTLSRIDKGGSGGVAPASTSASMEAVRKVGPVNIGGNNVANVASLKVPAGSYVITAKSTISTSLPVTNPLSDLAGKNASAGANCRLMIPGSDEDRADANVVVDNRPTPSTLYMQVTGTVAAETDIKVECAAAVTWTAANTSIIATKVSSVGRVDSTG